MVPSTSNHQYIGPLDRTVLLECRFPWVANGVRYGDGWIVIIIWGWMQALLSLVVVGVFGRWDDSGVDKTDVLLRCSGGPVIMTKIQAGFPCIRCMKALHCKLCRHRRFHQLEQDASSIWSSSTHKVIPDLLSTSLRQIAIRQLHWYASSIIASLTCPLLRKASLPIIWQLKTVRQAVQLSMFDHDERSGWGWGHFESPQFIICKFQFISHGVWRIGCKIIGPWFHVVDFGWPRLFQRDGSNSQNSTTMTTANDVPRI